MDSGGTINALGKQYIGSQPAQTSGSGNADGPKAPGGGGGGGGVTISSSGSKSIPFQATFALPFFLVSLFA